MFNTNRHKKLEAYAIMFLVLSVGSSAAPLDLSGLLKPAGRRIKDQGLGPKVTLKRGG